MADAYAQMRANFAAQFDDEDGRLVFRANGSGPAIPVSAVERDSFVADYDRFLSRWRWRMIMWLVAGLVVAGAALFLLDLLDGAALYIGIAAGTAPAMIIWLRAAKRARSVPHYVLADRATVAPALAKDVARGKALRALPWPSLALLPAYAGFMLWRYDVWLSPFVSDHLFWTVLAAAMVVVCAVQAWRKWRVERGG